MSSPERFTCKFQALLEKKAFIYTIDSIDKYLIDTI